MSGWEATYAAIAIEGFGAGLNPQHGEPEQFEPRGDWVAVGVLKTRDQQTAAKVDNVGGGPDVLADLSVAADGDNPAPLDRQGATPATRRIGGEHRSVDEYKAGGHGRAVCQGSGGWLVVADCLLRVDSQPITHHP